MSDYKHTSIEFKEDGDVCTISHWDTRKFIEHDLADAYTCKECLQTLKKWKDKLETYKDKHE
ncbi:hypothetical protein UFOVP97_24 [uncultured Caudovirales phage]|uniref:Uncharacterized protein n=1 Tax=uncultured Caudovirales phage TaxID=2100421 RepID=A0A6J5L254_9CAUD|nr:hypothetical protein UFOVP97_24 [uncultured Caudovirales phage]CAB4134310.1 hypothetical protein UFOVP268_42 [uncultured Caudovirales phage]